MASYGGRLGLQPDGRRDFAIGFAPMAGSLILSAAAHAALLALAGLLVVAPRFDLGRELIRISLVPAGGSSGSPPDAGRHSPAPPAAPPVAAQPAPRVARVPAPRIARHVRKPSSREQALVNDTTRATEREAVAENPGRAEYNGAGSAVTSEGAGSGPGEGKGSGAGSGSDAGSGLQAHCLHCPKPVYPRVARLRGWEGTADVEVVVTADGKVREARISRSSGHEVLDDAAIAVARESRFQLPEAKGDAVRGLIAYGFRLRQ